MDTTPLPNRDGDLSDSDSLSTGSLNLDYYCVRVTSHDKFSFDELKAFIADEPQIARYVIGRETVPQEHFHLVLGVDVSVQIQDVKDIIRAFLVPLWQEDSGKLPKGFGNKQYNCQLSEDKDKAVSYALKLKEYVYEGFSDDYIQLRVSASFEKKNPSNFKSEFSDLEKRFMESDMDVMQFMKEYGRLKSKYGQQLTLTNAMAVANSVATRRDPSYWDELVENFLYKV